MTARDLAAVALKVWGVILVVNALASLPSSVLFVTLAPPVDPGSLVLRGAQVGRILDLAVHAALGLGLVGYADRVLGWTIPSGPALRIDVYASELAALAFALVGLFIVISGAQNIVSAVYAVSTAPSFPGPDNAFWYVWQQQREAIVRAFVQIAAGLVLMFWRRVIATAWWWLSGGGDQECASSPAPPAPSASVPQPSQH